MEPHGPVIGLDRDCFTFTLCFGDESPSSGLLLSEQWSLHLNYLQRNLTQIKAKLVNTIHPNDDLENMVLQTSLNIRYATYIPGQ